MKETSHIRSRRACLYGLLLQVVAAAACYGLSFYTSSIALGQLTWLLACGVPIWFVSLLVFRQFELASLEAMDLEELRREKQKVGASEGLFSEESGGLGYMVAAARLEWMQRWLTPAFGLIVGALLVGVGVWQWRTLQKVAGSDLHWPDLRNVEIGLVLSTLISLLLFFYARYAAGLGRLEQWRLLRACGSIMLAASAYAMAIAVAFGAHLYAKTGGWERAVTWAGPVIMALLGAEALLNFLLDIYRPRTPGVERRAAFDSRLIGLLSEPGGIAKSLAETINYQFGFQVSHTWFYQLLQRALTPLLVVAAIALWLLTSIVFVEPYERAIVLRFGKQVNAEAPLAPGLHLRRPWPFETIQKYNTGQLHQFMVGFKVGDTPLEAEHGDEPVVEQWTDEKHLGRDHYNFIVSPPAAELQERQPGAETRPASERAPVHMIRMTLLVQYRIRADELARFSQEWRGATSRDRLAAPHKLLRDLAWDETLRLAASSDVDALMGPKRDAAADSVRANLQRQADELGLGLEVVYAGILNLHPEKTVAEAFRQVVDAQQKKIAEIRKARVSENEILSKVAGDRSVALSLAHAIRQLNRYQDIVNREELAEGGPTGWLDEISAFDELRQAYLDAIEREWRLDEARFDLDLTRENYQQASGGTLRGVQSAEAHVRDLQIATDEQQASLQAQSQRIVDRLRVRLGDSAERLARLARARAGVEFWSAQLEHHLKGLEGEAAVLLADARAKRWELELKAASEVTRLDNERMAYRAAPEIFKARRYLQAIVRGIRNSRKYFLAFDPAGRDIRVRLETQEVTRPNIEDMSLEKPK